jgi:DNA-binding NarL/FixJ family response regulator
VLSNQTYLSPRIAGLVVDSYVRHSGQGREPSASDELTPREREVLQLIAEGQSTKEIALELNVSVKTIETHRRNVMEKLDLHNVAELTKYALRRGLTSLDA